MPLSESAQERRASHRIPAKEENRVEVSLWTHRGESLVGELLDISANGIALRFSLAADPHLPPGETVILPFTLPNRHDPVTLKAIVRTRKQVEGWWRYGLQFQLEYPFHAQFAEQFYALFNRRDAIRVKPRAETPVAVTVEVIGELSGRTFPARLKDVSVTGIGVLLAPDTGTALAAADLLGISLRFPISGRTLNIAGRIRHRTPQAGALCCGLRLAPDHCEHFESDQEELSDYVIHRQLEELADSPELGPG